MKIIENRNIKRRKELTKEYSVALNRISAFGHTVKIIPDHDVSFSHITVNINDKTVALLMLDTQTSKISLYDRTYLEFFRMFGDKNDFDIMEVFDCGGDEDET